MCDLGLPPHRHQPPTAPQAVARCSHWTGMKGVVELVKQVHHINFAWGRRRRDSPRSLENREPSAMS